ncbi:MAG: phosphate ABC transporter substrate-binding protein PstS [Thermoplasmata archaeon]
MKVKMNQNESERDSVKQKISEASKKKPMRGAMILIVSLIVVISLITMAWTGGLFGGSERVTLKGAGATFPFPLISKWIQVYENNTGVRVSYEGIGSSGGITRISDRLVDFAGSDAPLTPDKDSLGIVHIPETLGAVSIVYNIAGIGQGLKLTPDVLAGIYMRNITSWDDSRITSINPTLSLPNSDIIVVRRSDGSGTTFVFTSYLMEVNATWSQLYGSGKSVTWHNETVGGSGNAGVAGIVKTTPNSIGYVELAYAIENNMTYAALKNSAGNFVLPSLETTAAAANAAAASLPAGNESWHGVEIVNAPGAESYPIATFSYILIYKEQGYRTESNRTQAKALIDFLWWCIHDGQQFADDLQYVPLPADVVALNERTLRNITFNGVKLL